MSFMVKKPISLVYEKYVKKNLTKPNPNDSKRIAWIKHKLHDDSMITEEDKADCLLVLAKSHMAAVFEIMADRNENESSSEALLVRKARIDSEHVFRSEALINSLFENQASTQLFHQLIQKYLFDAETMAMTHFLNKEHTHKLNRIEALRMAIYSRLLNKFIVNQSFGAGADVNFWISKIFADQKLRGALKSALRAQQEKSPLQIDRMNMKSVTSDIALGQMVIELMQELQSLSIMRITIDSFPDSMKDYMFVGSLLDQIKESKLVSLVDIGFEMLADQLGQLYQTKFITYNPLFFLLPYEFHITDTWVPLTLNGAHSRQNMNSAINPVQAYDDLICRALQDHKLTIVTGDPFSGKTALTQKIAFEWATKTNYQPESDLFGFDLVFLTPLRDVPAGEYKTILALSLAYIRESSSVNFDYLERANLEGKNILFLLDGYDEERTDVFCDELHNIMQHKDNIVEAQKYPESPQCKVLVTRRPQKSIGRKAAASFLQIVGFNTAEQQKGCIRKNLAAMPNADVEKESKMIIAKTRKHGVLKHLAKSPMMLTFICLVYHELKNEDLITGSLTELLDVVIKLIIQRWHRKQGKELRQLFKTSNNLDTSNAQIAQNIIDKWRNMEQIRTLGKFAYEMLLNKKLVFEGKDFDNFMMQPELFSDVGLLLEETRIEGLTVKHKYQFVHKIFQEFFAALYVVYWTDGEDKNVTDESWRICADSPETDIMNQTLVGKLHEYHDLVQMILDVIMVEQPRRAFHSLKKFFSIVEHFKANIRFQVLTQVGISKEYSYLREILQHWTKLKGANISGMDASIDFEFVVPLSPANNTDTVRLYRFNFVAAEHIPAISIDCQNKIGRLFVQDCDFHPSRLLATFMEGDVLSRCRFEWLHIELTPNTIYNLASFKDITATDQFKSAKDKAIEIWDGNLLVAIADLTSQETEITKKEGSEVIFKKKLKLGEKKKLKSQKKEAAKITKKEVAEFTREEVAEIPKKEETEFMRKEAAEITRKAVLQLISCFTGIKTLCIRPINNEGIDKVHMNFSLPNLPNLIMIKLEELFIKNSSLILLCTNLVGVTVKMKKCFPDDCALAYLRNQDCKLKTSYDDFHQRVRVEYAQWVIPGPD